MDKKFEEYDFTTDLTVESIREAINLIDGCSNNKQTTTESQSDLINTDFDFDSEKQSEDDQPATYLASSEEEQELQVKRLAEEETLDLTTTFEEDLTPEAPVATDFVPSSELLAQRFELERDIEQPAIPEAESIDPENSANSNIDEVLKSSSEILTDLISKIEKNPEVIAKEVEVNKEPASLELAAKVVDQQVAEISIDDLSNHESLEHQLINKIAKIGQITQQQGVYLAEISKSFAKELEQLITRYRNDKFDVIDELREQQSIKEQLATSHEDTCSEIVKLKLDSKKIEEAKNIADSKAEECIKKIERLEAMVENEQNLRKQADARSQIAIKKAREYAALKKTEENRRIVAEKRAEKAVARAREVMSYFFNNAVEEGVGRMRQQQQPMMGGMSDFDDMLLLNKKASLF